MDLSPSNIMYFNTENNENCWKLINFDSACIAGETVSVSQFVIGKYTSPELIRARVDGTPIKAQFSMDIFSFGLILFYIENENIAEQNFLIDLIKSPKKIPVTTIGDTCAIYVIENLSEEKVNKRCEFIFWMLMNSCLYTFI